MDDTVGYGTLMISQFTNMYCDFMTVYLIMYGADTAYAVPRN